MNKELLLKIAELLEQLAKLIADEAGQVETKDGGTKPPPPPPPGKPQ
jgi:hypothetical protein